MLRFSGSLMEIADELLDACRSEHGGMFRQQIELLCAEWPLRQGWKRSLIGKTISGKVAVEFLRLPHDVSTFQPHASQSSARSPRAFSTSA